MRYKEFLTEGATPILYHYCSTAAALKIISGGKFLMSNTTGVPSEERMMPPGYPYFLSLTRSKVGDYHRYTRTSECMFVLDGTWLSARYKVKPVDYWERAWSYSNGERTRESEDRVFSRTPEMPIDGVTAIHVLLKMSDEYRSPEVRKLMMAAKLQHIPAYLYLDYASWRQQDTRQAVSISHAASLLKWEPPENYQPHTPGGPTRDLQTWRGYHPQGTPDSEVLNTMRKAAMKSINGNNYLTPWVELIKKNSKIELSPEAAKLLYRVKYESSHGDCSLGNDISNARKPNSGAEYNTANMITAFMRRNKYNTVELVAALKNKWNDA
jgi:hypothetical protein